MFSLEDIVVTQLTRRTGFPVRAGRLGGNVFTGKFEVEDFEIANPGLFPVTDFVSVLSASARVAPSSLLGRRVEVRECAVHLKNLTGVRAACGSVNVEQFRQALERRDPNAPGSRSQNGSSSREVYIERLSIKVDHVVTVDYSVPGGDRREYPILLNREFTEVTDLLALGPPMVEEFEAAGLSASTDSIFATVLPGVLWSQIDAMISAKRGDPP